MLKVLPGTRLLPDSNWESGRTGLRYQGDGHLVLYMRGAAVWGSGAFAAPGYVEMQGDGNLVAYDATGAPYWASDTYGPGGWLEISDAGMRLVGPTTLWAPDLADVPEPPIVPVPDRVVRPLVGNVRPVGLSFGDDTGPRLVHGCTDFGAVVKFHEDRDTCLRQLDVMAVYQQFVRAAWRLNGWKWTPSGLTIDPIRDGWFDEAMRGYLQACHERGIRVNLTCGDMNNWSAAQAEASIARVAQIAASVSPTVVMLHEWNEIRGTSPGGEDDVEQLRHLTQIWMQHYPWNLRGLSDPGTQDGEGMRRLSRDPANIALMHDVRWSVEDAIRRAFNTAYEGRPIAGKAVKQGEPTGPDLPSTLDVYQPVEGYDDLLAIYTIHVITGQASTYFNKPALVSRDPLDSTWGFKELPRAWRAMEIPEDIGQGDILPGHRSNAPLRVVGSNAHRADSAVRGNYAIGVISGGDRWQVKAGRSGKATAYHAGKSSSEPVHVVWQGDIREGETLPISGPTPTVVRIVS